jgi:PAS domain S-box-containing protein
MLASADVNAAERERLRIAALESYQVLDTAPEAAFDDIVTIAAEICGVPMALISLVDSKRQWFKAALGLGVSETPREIAFCAHAIQQDDVFLVEDATRDARFASNPLVTGDPNLRFYAGAPLVTSDGMNLGTLCVLDNQPRHLTKTQQLALEALARQVMLQLELRRAIAIKRDDDERNRLSEENLRRAQDAGGVGLFSLDLTTRMLKATPQFCKLFGVEEQALMPVHTTEALVVMEDWMQISRTRLHNIEDAPLDVEYRIRRKNDGALRWIARKGQFELDGNGKPARLVGAVRDVTERRVAEIAAAQSASQFQIFAQTLPNHVWTAPPNGRLDWFNNRMYDYCGLTEKDLRGTGWTQIVHPDDIGQASTQWANAVEQGSPYEVEFRLRGTDGTYRWFLSRAVPITAADGGIDRWVGTNTDIDDRKLAETKYAADRDRIWSLSREMMLICDLAGNIVAVNPSASRILGWSEAEMAGSTLGQFVHPDDVQRTAAEVGKLAAGANTLSFVNRYKTKEGHYKALSWTAVPDGQLIHGVARDITQQLATEEALRQAQKMEAVGQLTGGIAHDFNNLLQGISGSLDIIQRRVTQGRFNELERFISGAVKSTNRAAALTHRLLAFSRRQPLDARPLRANPLITSMEDMLRRTLGERIEFEIVLSGGLWQTMCDSNQLENAILNLVINARDAMPNGGKLTVETGNAHLDASYVFNKNELKAGQYVCISVSDTGTGMSADTITKAFEPFFTTKPIGQGTGLGLSMIYGFARQSEGAAVIYSEIGRGTTVKLYLPRHRGKSVEDEPTMPSRDAHVARENEVVLVVEDEPVVRGLIVELLNELGFQALEAADGPAGLAVLQSKQPIDLLITDVGLPGLNGRQIADAARQWRPNLRVLFMTGYAENAVISAGLLEPGMSMITKPFSIDGLAARISGILAGD